MTDYVVLQFLSGGESIYTMCHHSDLERGYVQIITRDENGAAVNHGLFGFNECKSVSPFPFYNDNKEVLKWSEREELFKKYPKLRLIA
jgi:hypothetical protein